VSVPTDTNGIARTVLADAGAATVTASAGPITATIPVLGGTVPIPQPPSPPPAPLPPIPVPPVSPPIPASISLSPISTTVGVSTAFSVGAFSGSSLIVSESWTFGDGASLVIPGTATAHAYTAAGIFTVIVHATDALGRTATSSAPVTVAGPPKPPDPALTLTLACVAAPHTSPTSCNLTARDETGAIVTAGVTSALWSFGDGSTLTTTTPTAPLAQRTYTQVGVYTVSVSAVGPGGRTGSASTTVTIL
jgi:PKD repeat protein